LWQFSIRIISIGKAPAGDKDNKIMSQFDRYTLNGYVDALRSFIGANKRNFLRESGFVENPEESRRGRLPKYQNEPVEALEEQVNQKAARCEAADTTIGERYRLARDYLGLTDAEVARRMGVSRELVRQWGTDKRTPTAPGPLSELLGVPYEWLTEGGEQHLPADSFLGLRVGDEAKRYRSQLLGLTQTVVAEAPESDDMAFLQAHIEWSVFNLPALAVAARRAGGRWQYVEGFSAPLWAPWVPIPAHDSGRQLWSDEVEAIIEEELVRQPSVYGAHKALVERCKALGMREDQYPKRISLHKRVEKERDRIEKFGVDLNDEIAEAVEKYATH
jgi:DNA-binding transcriptional regulator YiaG